jgi:hypothetical protein
LEPTTTTKVQKKELGGIHNEVYTMRKGGIVFLPQNLLYERISDVTIGRGIPFYRIILHNLFGRSYLSRCHLRNTDVQFLAIQFP